MNWKGIEATNKVKHWPKRPSKALVKGQGYTKETKAQRKQRLLVRRLDREVRKSTGGYESPISKVD